MAFDTSYGQCKVLRSDLEALLAENLDAQLAEKKAMAQQVEATSRLESEVEALDSERSQLLLEGSSARSEWQVQQMAWEHELSLAERELSAAESDREDQQRKLASAMANCKQQIECQEAKVLEDGRQKLSAAESLLEKAYFEFESSASTQEKNLIGTDRLSHGNGAVSAREGERVGLLARELWEECEDLAIREAEQYEELERLEARNLLAVRDLEAERMLSSEMELGNELRSSEAEAEIGHWEDVIKNLGVERSRLIVETKTQLCRDREQEAFLFTLEEEEAVVRRVQTLREEICFKALQQQQ
eukprot:TRINITY_DN27769_c0_g1_i1.p1 TRINITY_DN27769_c0_g1~~TRINITY_DN27769_c0_g1_i1.p1  ORF type:complete len:356 (-),score=93.05 TRINITY_DN27769_c0_g1_i1:5-913(-)